LSVVLKYFRKDESFITIARENFFFEKRMCQGSIFDVALIKIDFNDINYAENIALTLIDEKSFRQKNFFPCNGCKAFIFF
jgi:hypothetical protein